MKTSAIDYLIEYINSEDEDKWLQSVVSCYLNSNEEISDYEIKNLIDALFTNNINEYSLDDNISGSSTSELIKINKLVHKSSFNALAPNQEIVFNDDVTVLYGMNGSGKSSYFRILQAILGNIKSSDIIPNIYSDNTKDISVDFVYSINKKDCNVNWHNDGEISDLKSLKVFDSKYSQKFLEKRESDEQVLYPYKLYMFSEISDYIDQIKRVANEQLGARLESNISPKIDSFVEEVKNRFEREMTTEDKHYFDSVAKNFDNTKENEILRIQSEIQSLLEMNYSDKLKLLDNRKEKYEKIKKQIENTLFLWIEKSVEYHNQINLYKEYKERSEKNRKLTSILSDLPGVESSEWKEFIKKGLLISENSEELNNTCPFCYREYDERSFLIVDSYLSFINDKTEVKLSRCESEMVVSNKLCNLLQD